MKYLLRVIAGIACLALALTAAGCSSSDTVSAKDTLRYYNVKVASSYEPSGIVCENNRWQLIWDNENKQIQFLDKLSRKIWSPTPEGADEKLYDEDGMLIKNSAIANAAIIVTYQDGNTLAEKEISSSTGAVENGNLYFQEIDNGIRIIYDFVTEQILVPVEYKIEENRFSISVNPKQIADDGVNKVTAVSIAPFLCGVKNNTEDSYLFIPDGSGTLLSTRDIDLVGKTGSMEVFGDDLTITKFNYTNKTQQCYLPVFGVKTGDDALVGIIESGAEAAAICWNVGSTNTVSSGTYSKFYIRGYTNVEAPRGFAQALSEIKYYADHVIQTTVKTVYYSLNGEDASVSGMADLYRSYLIENQGLAENKSSEKIAAFKYVGAVEQPSFFLGIPATKLYSLTTTENAEEMTENISELIGNNFSVNLMGYGTSGADIGELGGGFTVAGSLGGNKGLKNLGTLFNETGVDWYMDFDLISYEESGNGVKISDSAVFPNKKNAFFTDYNVVTRNANDKRYYILGRNMLNSVASNLLKKAEKMQLKGISLSSLSNNKYSDYSSTEYESALNMSKSVTKVFDTVKKGGYNLQAVAANSYAAITADSIIDAPLYSSSYDISFADVPFYELVFKGYVPMSSVSVNLCSDENDAFLRCVESGISPTYTLTYNYDNELITTDHSFIFATSYSKNINGISEKINSVKSYLSSIDKAKISGYKMLSSDVRITYFDNGVYSVVNYSSEATDTEYGRVAANSFITGRVLQ